jgi:N-methylhydantoinase A
LAFAYSADMRYRGQAFNIEVPIPAEIRDGAETAGLYELFHREHERLYGFREEKGAVEAVTARVTVSAQVCRVPLARVIAVAHPDTPPGARDVYHDGAWRPYAIYQRDALAVGRRLEGPAIIEQADTTIPLLSGWSATIDPFGNLVLERGTAS